MVVLCVNLRNTHAALSMTKGVLQPGCKQVQLGMVVGNCGCRVAGCRGDLEVTTRQNSGHCQQLTTDKLPHHPLECSEWHGLMRQTLRCGILVNGRDTGWECTGWEHTLGKV